MDLLNIVFFTVLFGTTFAELAVLENCDGGSDDICKVSEVRITPGPKRRGSSIIIKGANTTMSFDFTPNFNASNLQTEVYWVNGVNDVAFAGFGSTDACLYTQCPTQAGQQQTLNYNLYVNKKLPRGVFPLKWKTWNVDEPTQLCCFRTSIELKNKKK